MLSRAISTLQAPRGAAELRPKLTRVALSTSAAHGHTGQQQGAEEAAERAVGPHGGGRRQRAERKVAEWGCDVLDGLRARRTASLDGFSSGI